MAEQEGPIALLSQRSFVNGMLCLHWDNYAQFDPNYGDNDWDHFYSYVLSWRFLFNGNANRIYQDKKWIKSGELWDIFNEDHETYIKVPSLLREYEIEYKLCLTLLDEIEIDEDEGNMFGVTANSKKYHSRTYRATVPSILKETEFKKDDVVQFYVPNASFVWTGKVLEVMDDDMIKVQNTRNVEDIILSHPRLPKLEMDEMTVVTLHSSKIIRNSIQQENVIDTTHRHRAEIELILKNDNKECHTIYSTLSQMIQTLCCDEIIPGWMDVIQCYDPGRDGQFMSMFMAINIMEFLFCPTYNLRLGCVLGKSDLYLEQSWIHDLRHQIEEIRRGGMVTDIQIDRLHGVGYSCNICRIAMNWNDYLFACNCGCDMSHEFCVSCIHSILIQYEEMKPFMNEILRERLDDNSIELIVVYCVGKVIRYDHDSKKTNLKRKNECIAIEAVPHKRRKLNSR